MTGGRQWSTTSDWLQAAVTFLGEQLSIAVCTVRLVVLRRKLLACERLATVLAREAVAMPRCVLVCNAALSYHLHTTIIHPHSPRKTTKVVINPSKPTAAIGVQL